MGAQKANKKPPETKHKVIEDSDLNDREFKIVVMKELSKVQKNSEKQFNELRKKIIKQK